MKLFCYLLSLFFVSISCLRAATDQDYFFSGTSDLSTSEVQTDFGGAGPSTGGYSGAGTASVLPGVDSSLFSQEQMKEGVDMTGEVDAAMDDVNMVAALAVLGGAALGAGLLLSNKKAIGKKLSAVRKKFDPKYRYEQALKKDKKLDFKMKALDAKIKGTMDPGKKAILEGQKKDVAEKKEKHQSKELKKAMAKAEKKGVKAAAEKGATKSMYKRAATTEAKQTKSIAKTEKSLNKAQAKIDAGKKTRKDIGALQKKLAAKQDALKKTKVTKGAAQFGLASKTTQKIDAQVKRDAKIKGVIASAKKPVTKVKKGFQKLKGTMKRFVPGRR